MQFKNIRWAFHSSFHLYTQTNINPNTIKETKRTNKTQLISHWRNQIISVDQLFKNQIKGLILEIPYCPSNLILIS